LEKHGSRFTLKRFGNYSIENSRKKEELISYNLQMK
jgi:hypothetical protein